MRSFILFVMFFAFSLNAETKVPDSYKSLFKPLPKVEIDSINENKIKLGRKLYFEKRLSKASDISCNSCHQLDSYGVDGKQFSEGDEKQLGGRNSPTVYNAALHFLQFWDGRAKDVEEQALGPILNPVEMAMESEQQVVDRIKEDKEYQELFKIAFLGAENPLTFKNIGNAIGAFERTLLTPSRFDEYLQGEDSAITDKEKAGMKLFVETGCTACHNGATLGGNMFQKLGLVKAYPTKDIGRAEVTGKDYDKYFFKVPSLRNIEKTGPYFHDGSIKTLEEAVSVMASYQLGKDLEKQEIQSIMDFLNSLTAEIKP